MGLMELQWAQKTLNISNEPIWAQNRPKWAQISKPKWAEKSLNELKWVLMSSNFNKIFTTDAYQMWNMLRFLKWRNKCQK